MKILRQYRPFFFFLLKFFGVYGLLAFLYHLYLSQFDKALFEVDSVTIWVAKQAKWVTDILGYQTDLKLHALQPAVRFILNGNYIARVVEGCNGLSVIIMFAAFVIAFTGRWKTTVAFIISGAVIIHILNVIRIGLLSIALLHYPQYESLLHGVIFPAVIYGVVLLLWVVWVNKFSKNDSQRKN